MKREVSYTSKGRGDAGANGTYGLWLEPLDEDAVEERDDRLDGLEGRLGRLVDRRISVHRTLE